MRQHCSGFDGLYYVFEYDFDGGYKVEYVTSCKLANENGKYISEDTYVGMNYTSAFFACYIFLANHFGDITSDKYSDCFKICPSLLDLIEYSLLDENMEETKTDYENIKIFLKNKNCHNETALNYFCRFMNREMPKHEEDIINVLPISSRNNNDPYYFYTYLQKNIKSFRKKIPTVEAESKLGLETSQLIYKINTPMDLFLATLYILYNIHGTIKLCKNCGMPFLLYKNKNIV